MIIKSKSISVKLGIIFSAIFIPLFLILGFVLYGVFTNIFVDYIEQDLLARTNNHARILEKSFTESTIAHVMEMEQGVASEVLITDPSNKVLNSSIPWTRNLTRNLTSQKVKSEGKILDNNWKEHEYIIAVSPIGTTLGFIYMYYPSSILREIVFVINILFAATSTGILLMAFGLIGILSRGITKPLLAMKEATTKMAKGKYKQTIPVKGQDEIAQLGISIQELGEQLKSYEDNRNDFLAAVSHELRTPLTYIKGYSDVLKKGLIKDKQEQEDYLKIINKEAHRVAYMVNDLFEMSKLQTGNFLLEKVAANINIPIEKVLVNLGPVAMKKGLELKKEIQPDLPDILIDLGRMEQVFYNLIENSIKFTSQGSITVRTFVKNEYVASEIRDTGKGIPFNDIPKIFDQFYRVDQSRTRKTGGTGLGLYVVKQIVEAHHGEIHVSSNEYGTVFTLFFKFKL
ncbi:cell wall metabolism sensor histidine kinase WalK [Bacillus sp. FJAT-27445]|uniref:sensor histidine kinase n=1 Tax=Bacillus sp. FJAT-27445 TaxID=1679166 RepID=UPI000743898B|nr:ATP-binding protein [Bacillus sp. FJAT-27445]